ncbi:ferredoxin [Streptomyces sp. NPDC002018]|uniref:ferredoxin n=1 Tax=Streptomyces sp. NPDC002018 TaxID=3364629 RepID=UPI0036A572FE
MTRKATVDEDKCRGAGQRVLPAPDVFDPRDEDRDVFDRRDEDRIVVLLDATPPEPAHPTVREAAVMCPAAATERSESE